MSERQRPIQKSGRFAGKPYRKSQKAYAVDFSVSLPTVKRWWAKGLPCDDPDAMGEFLSPRGRKADDDDEDFEAPSIVPPGGDQADPATPDALPGDVEPEAPVRLDETFFEGSGFLAEIDAMRKAAKQRRAAYFVAVTKRLKGSVIRSRLSEWMLVIEALRKVEKDLPGIRKANNQVVDRAWLEVAIGTTFAAFRKAARREFTRLIEKLGLG